MKLYKFIIYGMILSKLIIYMLMYAVKVHLKKSCATAK